MFQVMKLLEILTKDRSKDLKDVVTDSKSPSTSLSNFLRDFFPHQIDHRGRNIPQILIVDQLEELFNFYSDPNRWHEQQEDFFNQIAHVLESDPLLRIVFVIREDYLAQILDLHGNYLKRLKQDLGLNVYTRTSDPKL